MSETSSAAAAKPPPCALALADFFAVSGGPGLPSLIDQPGGAQDHEAGRVDLGARLGDEGLDDLLVGQGLPVVDLAAEGTLTHEGEGALTDAEPAHAVVDAAGAEALLGDEEAGARGAQAALHRDAAAGEADLGVAGKALVGFAHDRDVADADEARRIGWHEQHGGALVGGGVGLGHGHDDRKGGAVGRRGEPLVAVDDVVIAVEDGAGAELGGVTAGRVGLGHREAAAHFAAHQRAQETILLLGGAVLVEDLDVAGVGGLAAEGVVAEGTLAEHLADQSKVGQRQPQSPELGRRLWGPQPRFLDLATDGVELGLDGVEALV